MTIEEKRALARAGMAKLSVAELAYIAAMIDGEGSIGIYQALCRSSKEPGRGQHYPAAIIRTTISNSHRGVIEWLQTRIPGSRAYSYPPRNPKHLPMSRLTVDGIWGTVMLQHVLPYMIIKPRLAELAISLHAGYMTNGTPLTVAERARRLAILDEFAQLRAELSTHKRASWGRLGLRREG